MSCVVCCLLFVACCLLCVVSLFCLFVARGEVSVVVVRCFVVSVGLILLQSIVRYCCWLSVGCHFRVILACYSLL